ncbi:AraC family transcriptional regulator, partial [Bradyrhizobium sp. WSM 1704]|nr:AraC family transcriptional regulator [Bradyrhizobium semiaridum]
MQDDDNPAARAAKHLPLPREPRDLKDISAAPPLLFSTRPYRPAEQFEVWKTRMASLLDVAPAPGHDPARGFEVEYLTCNMANVVFTSGRFAAQTFARVPRPSQRPRVDFWWLFRVR